MTVKGLRYRQYDCPLRYVARDRDGHPEHARWAMDYDPPRLEWVRHEPGGKMTAFNGPDDVWETLIEGGMRF